MNNVINVEAKRDGDILMLKIDLSQRHWKSTSGKSTVIAVTGGSVPIPGSDRIRMGVNVYEMEALQ
jgi:hypothetical protein